MTPFWRNLAAWLTLIAFFPLICIIFIPLKIYKTFLTIVAQSLNPRLRGLLTSYDSIFAIDKYYKKPFACNITFIVLQGNIDLEHLKACFVKRVLKTKSADKLFGVPKNIGGYYFWKIIPIDLDKHVRFVRRFQSLDHEDELNRMLGELMTAPLPKDSGLWELLLYPGFKENCTVIVFRMHHVLGDGYSFNHLVDLMIEEQSPYLVKPSRSSLYEGLQLVANAPYLISKLYQEGFTHKDCYTQKKINDSGVASLTTLPLDTMKQIRRYTKTHFATVGMSLLGGALRRHFLETKSESELPDFVSIMHSLPRPNHPLGGDNSQEGKMCNHWGVGLFKIPLKTTSALDRLLKAEASFGEYMSHHYDLLIHSHIPLFSLLPNKAIELFFSTNFGTAMGFTSVPAYEKEAEMFGYRVLNMFKVFGLQWSQTAVAAAMYSHNGQVSYSIFANQDIIPDQKSIDRVTREYIHEEMQNLVAECGLTSSRYRSIREGFA